MNKESNRPEDRSIESVVKKVRKMKEHFKKEFATEDLCQLESFVLDLGSVLDLGNVADCPCEDVCNCQDMCTNECDSQCTCHGGHCPCQHQCPCKNVDSHSQYEQVSRPVDVWDLIRLYPGINILQRLIR